ncbi:MAG: DUF4169 family protein [Hyphomicrobiales bacterium]|nr:DUF4169 family protein [Hyphomicrobiales bacterium]
MNGDIINLRQARKRKARGDKADRAAENRVRFGRTKAEKSLDQARGEKAARDLDGHRRNDDERD